MKKLNATTFAKTVKDNPKDRISVEVGDSKQPDFKPQVKIMRWDNEVNFSMRAEEDQSATLEDTGGVVKYKAKDYEVHLYEKPEAGEDGGFEFEWILPKKPKSNVLTTTIQTKGLDFFYQPALTQEEIDEGASRPENVVGSYAVYHSTKGGMNDAAGMEYKTGKAFHIYRPKAVDANGVEVWCDLNINETNGTLSVTVPQKFLDEAVYPVRIDPTFGYGSIGGTTDSVYTGGSPHVFQRLGHTESISEDGTLTQIDAVIIESGTSGNDITAVYLNVEDGSGSGSHTQTAFIERSNVDLTGGGFIAYTASSESLTNGTSYVLNMIGRHGGFNITTKYDSTGTANYYIEQKTNSSVPTGYTNMKESPWTATVTGTGRKYSIYATYTASGGGVTPKPISNMLLMGV